MDGPIGCMELEPRGPGFTPEFESFFEVAERALREHPRHGAVIDLEGSQADSVRRRRLVAWVERRADLIQSRLVAVGLVAHNPVERGVITAVLWMIRPALPVAVFAERSEAISWVAERLAERDAAPLA